MIFLSKYAFFVYSYCFYCVIHLCNLFFFTTLVDDDNNRAFNTNIGSHGERAVQRIHR